MRCNILSGSHRLDIAMVALGARGEWREHVGVCLPAEGAMGTMGIPISLGSSEIGWRGGVVALRCRGPVRGMYQLWRVVQARLHSC